MNRAIWTSLASTALVSGGLGRKVGSGKPSEPTAHHISVSCGKNCTDEERAGLPVIVNQLNAVLASDCFESEFRARKPDTELTIYDKAPKGQSATTIEEVITTMRTKPYAANLTFYDHPFHLGRACAKEGNDDSADIPVKTYCYDVIDNSDALKAGTIIHEISHKFGYGHFTDNNEDWVKGGKTHINRTVPYSIEHAVTVCWGKVSAH